MKYPFDPKIKNHLLIGLLLAIWIFVFLYFTEPLDVDEFGDTEKLIYLPGYGIIGGISYLLFLPLQYKILSYKIKKWTIAKEIVFLLTYTIITLTFVRLYYLYVIMDGIPNPYTLGYMLKAILLPAAGTIIPIIIIARFAFGKYFEKQVEDQKIEIKGEGNFEGIRLHLNDLISIQSSDNYIEVLYLSGNELKKTLIRNKLSVIDETFDELIRTHRSYLINPYHFQQWKTEKGKHFLILNHSIEIPISKTYLSSIKQRFNSTTTA
ncbi:LytTR family DNA-binding domain-containing protein [Mesoflavibacter sp. SCSIO 43206]|uniref:LytTR family DNA-binding domain-containing protein n=1 Tax=Mesoflavibacter sp. SCSIO 43206 TaxID=2779362 RepID=UPI001CA99DB6|nr:LytTR family DNA-binding domain-containing protein [Mesoflavibacter sp. SCSIO 43206]UAB75168.1 LytTR family transcriptional regulator [Mesoflavibacter sp. SCSIO 43206]